MKALGVLLFVAACSVSFGQTFIDDFNRADAADLGANWDVIGTGSATRTVSNEAGNVSAALNLSLVKSTTFVGAFDQTIVSADFRTTDTAATTAYVALALGQDGSTTSGHGIYVKLQRQTGSLGGFNNVGFYTAAGTNNTTAITGGTSNFFALTSEVSSGRMSIWCSDPVTINLGIDTDFNGTFEQTYSRTLSTSGGFVAGNRVGIAVYSSVARMDNFNASVVPEPISLTAFGLGVMLMARRRKK